MSAGGSARAAQGCKAIEPGAGVLGLCVETGNKAYSTSKFCFDFLRNILARVEHKTFFQRDNQRSQVDQPPANENVAVKN